MTKAFEIHVVAPKLLFPPLVSYTHPELLSLQAEIKSLYLYEGNLLYLDCMSKLVICQGNATF